MPAESRANCNVIIKLFRALSCKFLKTSIDGEWRSHDVFGQPVPVLNHCLGERCLYAQLKFPLLQTVITIQCLLIVPFWEEARSFFSTTLFSISFIRELKTIMKVLFSLLPLASQMSYAPVHNHLSGLSLDLLPKPKTTPDAASWVPNRSERTFPLDLVVVTLTLLQRLLLIHVQLVAYHDTQILFWRSSSPYQHTGLFHNSHVGFHIS